MPGSTTTTTTAAPAFNTPPTMLRLPLEILDAIVFELTELTPLGPPHPTVLPLLLTCKALHAAFSPKRNPALWTRIFRARFDVRAVERRAMRPTYEQCIAQMELWCRTLKVLRRGDVYGVWERAERRAGGPSRSADGETEAEAEEEAVGEGEGEGEGGPEDDDPADDDELDVGEALFMACVMMLEDDGKNARQLLEYARAYEFAERFVKQRLYEGKEANDGWPCETSINACAVNLLWMLTDEEKLKRESQADRDLMINILLPFVFNPYRYMQAEAPPNHYTLPITRILRTQHISTIETVHGPYPIYAPQRTRTTITFPPPSSVQEAELEPEQQGQGQDQGQEPEQQPALDFTLTSRTTRLSRGGTSHVHYLSRPALATPLLAPAAKLLYFARKEVLPLGIPPHLARTREEAVRAGRLAWNEVGVTREDLEEVNWAWGTRMPLGASSGPGGPAAPEGGADVHGTTTTGNARWDGKAPHEMMFWRRFEGGKSRKWDLDWWRLRLCASPALVDDDDDEEGDSANASGGPPPPPSPSPLSFLASSSASVSSASLSTPARTQAHAPHAGEPDPAALDTRPGSVLPPPWLLTGLWQGRILTPEEATTRELLHNPFHPDFEGVAFARARARAQAEGQAEGQHGDAVEQDAALLQQGPDGDLAHTRFNETARMVLVRPLYVRLTELHGVRGFGHRASAEERRATAEDPGIGIGGALWEEEGEGEDGEEGEDEDEDEEDDGLDENMANAWFPGHPGTLKSRVVGQVYHDPSPSHRINEHAADEASGLTSLYTTEPPFRAPQHHRGDDDDDEEGDIVKRDLVELSVDPSLMNDQQHALGVGVAGHGWAGRRNVQQRNRRSVYVRLEDETPLVEVDVNVNVNVNAGGGVNEAKTSRGAANGKARAHGEAWTGHPHDETRCGACEARREVVEAGFRIARRREVRLLRSSRAAGGRGEDGVASLENEDEEEEEEERQREERERIWERNGFGMRGRPDDAEGADGGADGDGDEDGVGAGEEAEEVAKRWRLEREWWGPDQPLDHLGDAEMSENDDADDADRGQRSRPRHPVRLDPAPFPIDPSKRLGKKCDGVREVVLLGETDERHGLAWHHYMFYGRIRPWDGLIGLLRKPRNPWMGYVFMYGYIVGGENFVGNWRIVSGDDRAPVWESAFVLSKREDV